MHWLQVVLVVVGSSLMAAVVVGVRILIIKAVVAVEIKCIIEAIVSWARGPSLAKSICLVARSHVEPMVESRDSGYNFGCQCGEKASAC